MHKVYRDAEQSTFKAFVKLQTNEIIAREIKANNLSTVNELNSKGFTASMNPEKAETIRGEIKKMSAQLATDQDAYKNGYTMVPPVNCGHGACPPVKKYLTADEKAALKTKIDTETKGVNDTYLKIVNYDIAQLQKSEKDSLPTYCTNLMNVVNDNSERADFDSARKNLNALKAKSPQDTKAIADAQANLSSKASSGMRKILEKMNEYYVPQIQAAVQQRNKAPDGETRWTLDYAISRLKVITTLELNNVYEYRNYLQPAELARLNDRLGDKTYKDYADQYLAQQFQGYFTPDKQFALCYHVPDSAPQPTKKTSFWESVGSFFSQAAAAVLSWFR